MNRKNHDIVLVRFILYAKRTNSMMIKYTFRSNLSQTNEIDYASFAGKAKGKRNHLTRCFHLTLIVAHNH